MPHNQHTAEAKLAVYSLTQEVLKASFTLDMTSSQYDAQTIWDVLVTAAVERLTIDSACQLLEGAPSANTVRTALKSILSDKGLRTLEERVNDLLVARLPPQLLKKALVCAVDYTEIPYHGQHEAADEGVRRGRAKSGTTHFHSFGTLTVLHRHKRYTLALTLFRQSDKAHHGLQRLLKRGRQLRLRIKRLYLDRGFDTNGVVALLKGQAFPSIIALSIRGKTGGTRALCVGRKSYQTTYERQSRIYDDESFTVWIVCKYSKGRYRRKRIGYFAYSIIGDLTMPPHQIYEEYRKRFGIESTYRLMNTVRPRTSSRSVALRLFFVALALLLLNLWAAVKWAFLYKRQPGPRQVVHHLLPLARWRLWLWEVIKQRLGFALEISLLDL